MWVPEMVRQADVHVEHAMVCCTAARALLMRSGADRLDAYLVDGELRESGLAWTSGMVQVACFMALF